MFSSVSVSISLSSDVLHEAEVDGEAGGEPARWSLVPTGGDPM